MRDESVFIVLKTNVLARYNAKLDFNISIEIDTHFTLKQLDHIYIKFCF